MIHLIGISGSPVRDGNTDALLREAIQFASADREVQATLFYLSQLEINGCKHCNWCIKHQTLGKFCHISDGMDGIYPALLQADLLLLATPVHIGRISGLLANMLDRLRPFVYGNFYRNKLKDKVGLSIVLAFLRHGGLETTLQILNNTFALFQMISLGRGGLVLSSLAGQGKVIKGVRFMALQDEYGLSSVKETVQRGVEIAKIIQAGKRALGLL